MSNRTENQPYAGTGLNLLRVMTVRRNDDTLTSEITCIRVFHFLTNFEIENARGAIRWGTEKQIRPIFSMMTSF